MSQLPVTVSQARSVDSLLPKESKREYIKRYNVYKKFIAKQGLPYYTEESVLVWCEMLKQQGYQPGTLMTRWCSIKACLESIDNIRTAHWVVIKDWMKKNAKGTNPMQAPTFTAQQINIFLTRATDGIFIRHKVALILGLHGGLRASDYVNLYHNKNAKERISVLSC